LKAPLAIFRERPDGSTINTSGAANVAGQAFHIQILGRGHEESQSLQTRHCPLEITSD